MKRFFELLVATIGMLILLPVLLLLSMWIKIDSRGPVFYRGWRAGQFGKPFRIFKFRTMAIDPNDCGQAWTRSNDPRITRAGRILRRYKLDELPQLLNVTAGHMSLVGPRPEVLDRVDRYTDEERQLLTVRPGITDWASVKFCDEGEALRNCEDPGSWYEREIRPEKVRLGLEYVRTRSWRVDTRIMVETLKRLTRLSRQTANDD